MTPQSPSGAAYEKADQARENLASQARESRDSFQQYTNDLGAMGREQAEAFMQFSTKLAKGVDEIIRKSMDLAQKSAAKQSELIKIALSSKSLNEWQEAQNKLAKNSFDDFMTNATAISELSVRVLTESAEPLNAQVNKSIKKANEKMAA